MLVISSKPGNVLRIGEEITVRVLEIQGGRVRLAIDAPEDLRICRNDGKECSGKKDLDNTKSKSDTSSR